MKKKYKLAVLASHPVQYKAPLFKKIALETEIDLMVYYCWKGGAEERYDPGFGIPVKWDTQLLNGYHYKFLNNLSPRPGASKIGHINPGIIKEIKINHYDAIWVNGYTSVTAWFAFLIALISGTPIIFRGEADLHNRRSLGKRFVKRLVLTPLFRLLDAFLYSCTSNYNYYRHYGVPKDKLFFCPSAIDNDWYWEQERCLQNRNDDKKSTLEISSTAFVILFVGKLIPRKRPLDLLLSFEQLEQENDIALIYVGEGPEREKLEKYVLKNRIKDVYFTGFQNQSQIPAYYSIGDVFVHPSERDPSPKVLNEALAMGLPVVVSSEVGTAVDLVQVGCNGYTFPVGEQRELVEAIRLVMENPTRASKLGACSREIASKWSYSEGIIELQAALDFIKPRRK